MILYHLFLTYYNGKFNYNIYFSFIPYGFILLSGMLAGELFNKNIKINYFKNAIKLLIIFLVLNILKWAIYNTDINLFKILIIGDSALSSFEILLPISYLMLIINIKKPKLIILLLVILIVLSQLFEYSYNLTMILSGLIGYSISNKYEINSIKTNNKYYLCSSMVILILLTLLQQSLLLFILETILLIFIIQSINNYSNFIINIGKNSLNIYIIQILLFKSISLLTNYYTDSLVLIISAFIICILILRLILNIIVRNKYI